VLVKLNLLQMFQNHRDFLLLLLHLVLKRLLHFHLLHHFYLLDLLKYKMLLLHHLYLL
tara:strand:+ start:47 stop:220 length:174 start_codon:yes stop_codon:yes gene_type:complete